VLYRIKKDVFVEHLNATFKTYKGLAGAAHIAMGTITNSLNDGCSLGNIESMGRTMKMPNWLDLLIDDDRASLITDKDRAFHDWPEVEDAANKIGDYLFNEFDANIILTFSGHSWIFASLVMAMSLPRERLLSIPVYLALTMDWKPSTAIPRLKGFKSLPGLFPDEAASRYGLAVLMPENFPRADKNGKRRVAVIDDSITSGAVPPVVIKYLKRNRYRPGPKRRDYGKTESRLDRRGA
jgi:hypothetical protein